MKWWVMVGTYIYRLLFSKMARWSIQLKLDTISAACSLSSCSTMHSPQMERQTDGIHGIGNNDSNNLWCFSYNKLTGLSL